MQQRRSRFTPASATWLSSVLLTVLLSLLINTEMKIVIVTYSHNSIVAK